MMQHSYLSVNRVLVPLVLVLAVVLTLRLFGVFTQKVTDNAISPVTKQESGEATAKQPSPVKSQPASSIPTVSALDTRTLLNNFGKETQVIGIPTHIEYTRPKSNPDQTWACIFFNNNSSEALSPGFSANQSPWDFLPYFRIIVKPGVMDNYAMSLLLNENITLKGTIDYYCGTPTIYLTSPEQITRTE
jgi:hypothetical protein